VRCAVLEICTICREHQGEARAPGGVIYQDHLWRLDHCPEPIPLAGWLVLKPLRHVEALADLTGPESQVLGALLRRVAQAMERVMEPARIAVCLWDEAADGAHIQFHLIPQRTD